MHVKSILMLAACVAMAFQFVASANPPITPPTYDELLTNSDLVCIIHVSQVAQATEPAPGNPDPADLNSYLATCKILSTSKGQADGPEIKISFFGHLFGLPERRVKAPLVETDTWPEREVQYLAFLKKGKGGVFLPAVGDLDQGFSFRVLLQSFALELKGLLKQRQTTHNDGGPTNRRQPIRTETNSTPPAADSRR